MAKKGKSKNKSKSKGGAAAAKKVADTPAALLPEQEVEETVTKSDAEPETVVTDAGAAVTADPTSVLPDTAAKGITAAPLDDSTEEASDAVDSSSPNADEPATEAVKEEVEEPIAVAGTTTTLPERPKDTVFEPETHETHVKRPYESSLTTKDEDHKPPKIPKVEEDLDATISAKAVEPTSKDAVGAAAVPADEAVVPAVDTAIQPQMVPGLGTDPSDNIDRELEVPGLNEDTASPNEPATTSSSTIEPVTTDAAVDKAAAETVAPVSLAPVSVSAVQPEITGAGEVPTTKELEVPTTKELEVPTTNEELEAPTSEQPAAADNVAKETTKEESASHEPTTAATDAEPVIVVPSSITDADIKGTDAAVVSAADSAPAAEAQKPVEAAEEKVNTAGNEAPEEKLDAAEAEAPEESAAPTKIEETQPQNTESQPASAAKDAQEIAEAPSETQNKPSETTGAQNTSAAGTTEGAAAAQEPENKSAADQPKDTAKLTASRAQESAKSDAAKGGSEKRKSGSVWSWLKRKVKGDKN